MPSITPQPTVTPTTPSTPNTPADGVIPDPTQYPLPSHHSIGEYVLSHTLGKGAYATVKLARHLPTGQLVAIKMIRKSEVNRSADRVKRLAREVEAMIRIDAHPHIVHLVEVLETPSSVGVVMEYVPGRDLHKWMKSRQLAKTTGPRQGLPMQQAFRFFYQLVSALQHCHERNIVHRDIKLDNIIVDELHDCVKLTDFGLCNFVKGRQLMETSCGSPHYVAPEIIIGKKYDGKAVDVWSLGVVLFALRAGRLPFVDISVPHLLRTIVEGQYAFPTDFEAPLRNLINHMLDPSPTRRITMQQIKAHPWWLKNCALYGLPAQGIAASVVASALASPLSLDDTLHSGSSSTTTATSPLSARSESTSPDPSTGFSLFSTTSSSTSSNRQSPTPEFLSSATSSSSGSAEGKDNRLTRPMFQSLFGKPISPRLAMDALQGRPTVPKPSKALRIKALFQALRAKLRRQNGNGAV